jgi:glycosyltransferase
VTGLREAPLVSVITVSFNAGSTIAATVRSVRAQTFGEYEHLLIDGASRDNTLEVARGQGDERLVVHSERDRGIYDAMNKGLAKARGRYTLFLNADDRFADAGCLAAIVETLLRRRADALYGDIRFVTASGASTRLWRPGRYHRGLLSLGWIAPHPGFTARTELLREVGGFNLAYPIAADYDLMLRVLQRTPTHKVAYLPRELVVMQQGGESTASARQMARGLLQCARSMQSNAVPLWQLSALLKPARALGQVFGALAPAR